jgi:hypothetical protein
MQVPQAHSAFRSQTKIVHAYICLKWSIGRQMGKNSKMMLPLNVMGKEETFGILILL